MIQVVNNNLTDKMNKDSIFLMDGSAIKINEERAINLDNTNNEEENSVLENQVGDDDE